MRGHQRKRLIITTAFDDKELDFSFSAPQQLLFLFLSNVPYASFQDCMRPNFGHQRLSSRLLLSEFCGRIETVAPKFP